MKFKTDVDTLSCMCNYDGLCLCNDKNYKYGHGFCRGDFDTVGCPFHDVKQTDVVYITTPEKPVEINGGYLCRHCKCAMLIGDQPFCHLCGTPAEWYDYTRLKTHENK